MRHQRHQKCQKVPKSAECFYCSDCDYYTSHKSHYKKHLLTKKHLNNASPNVTKSVTKTSKKLAKLYFCEHCGSEYKSRNGLWRHKKKCEYINEPEEEKKPAPQGGVFLTTEQLNLLLNHKTMGNNNTNCNNTYNNSITVQIYLDEHCKDAKTIESMVDKLKSQVEYKLKDIMYSTNSQLIKDAPANLFIKEIKSMPAEERPVHCADGKRGKFWVKKEEEGWVKEDVNEGGGLKNTIQGFKNKLFHDVYKEAEENELDFDDKWLSKKQKIMETLLKPENHVDNAIIAKLASECSIKDAIKDIEKTD